MDELELRDSWRVGLSELSALALRPTGAGGGPQLVGVGDSAFTIVLGDAEPPGSSHVSADLSAAVARDSDTSSQWEGLAADAAGRVFVLQEHAGPDDELSHVFVFAPELKLTAVIQLVVEEDAEWAVAWRENDNARGEAIALLRDGHLLVAQQKEPVHLIEFGPQGADAVGLAAAALLPGDEAFELPDGSRIDYHVLASWAIREPDRNSLGSINDLATSDGELYAISRTSHVVAKLEANVRPEEKSVAIERLWSVPGEIHHPEGLVVLAGIHIVADDVSAEKDTPDRKNIFRLVEPDH